MSFACQLTVLQSEAAVQKEEKQMHSAAEPELRYKVLQHRLKESFAPTYLTSLSVIQGVALADLASVVADGSKQFTILHWLLVVVVFGLLIAIWNLYTIHSMIWDWVPDLRDATIPFVLGALELFLNHMIIVSLSAWLLVVALLGGMATLAVWHARWRASKEAENTKLLNLLSRPHRWIMLYAAGASIFILLLAVASRAGSLEASDPVQGGRGVLALVLVLLVGGCLGGAIYFSILYWKWVAAYTDTGRVPSLQKAQAPDADHG